MVITLAVALFGMIFGSFINAWVWRVHEVAFSHKPKKNSQKKLENLSVLTGRSICPQCRHVLATKDLVPVFSWIYLRGKCRYCHNVISLQYPAVELITAILFGLSYYVMQPTNPESWALLTIWLAQIVVLVALAVFDIRWMLLPNKILAILSGLAGIGLFAEVFTYSSFQPLQSAMIASVLAGGLFYFVFAISRGKWMGGGDVKLAFVMGLLLGIRDVGVALMIGFATAALVGVGLIALKRISRKSLIPFGPFLILGTIIAGLWGEKIFQWYQNIVIIN